MSLKINKDELNSSNDSQYGGVCENKTPVIGYVKSSFPSNLVVYSLKTETAIHIWRFGSPILKFKTSLKNTANKVIVLLREGLLQVMNLKSMNQEVAIPLHFIQSNLLNKPRDEIDIALITSSLPKLFDSCSNFFCYSFNQMN